MLNPLRIKAAIAAGAAAAFFTATPALADTKQTNLSVNASVSANCSISAGALNFGTNIDTLSASNVDGTATLSVTCTNGSSWSAGASTGIGASATYASRRMTRVSGTETLAYTLYTDSGRSTVWGDGSGSTANLTGTGTGSTQSVTIYGRIPSGQTSVPAGSYADTVSVTITY